MGVYWRTGVEMGGGGEAEWRGQGGREGRLRRIGGIRRWVGGWVGGGGGGHTVEENGISRVIRCC